MNWEGLGEDNNDDRFFESFDRLSLATPLDMASSGSDDDEFDDSRMSFASAISSAATDVRGIEAVRAPTSIFGDYDMWTVAPGSIKDRRRRLLQGMGLSSNKNLLSVVSTKLMNAASKKVKNDQPSTVPVESSPSDKSKPEPSPEPLPATAIVLVRSRSDGDIESCSANTRRRKEELIGAISKQRLTRTSSMILAPQAVRVSPQKARRNGSSIPNSGALQSMLSNGQFGAFFLIKDLDTGKEFIVKEFNNDGMWNRLSEVQTGKQLTMEEFEKSVGYSP